MVHSEGFIVCPDQELNEITDRVCAQEQRRFLFGSNDKSCMSSFEPSLDDPTVQLLACSTVNSC